MQPSRLFGVAAVCASAVRRGNHRVEQRQRDRGSGAAEQRATRQMFLRDEHRFGLSWLRAVRRVGALTLICIGTLCATPSTSAENR